MYEAMNESKPILLTDDEYHLPYVSEQIFDECVDVAEDMRIDPVQLALKVSASCCAQVSYRTMDTGISKALKIYKQLVESTPIHASPFEHQARPINAKDIASFHSNPRSQLEGLTHMSRDGSYWSGNLRGWVQHRHEIPNNTCWEYEK